jgi:hypothetical protein
MKSRALNRWHSWLGMQKFDREWHENDLAEELAEYHDETKLLKKWGELSDVVYTCTRSRWSGHELDFPLRRWQFFFGVPYMLWKYTSRFLFYKHAGEKAGADKTIRCVRNPHKLEKLSSIIDRDGIHVDEDRLLRQCRKQLKYWPLLP